MFGNHVHHFELQLGELSNQKIQTLYSGDEAGSQQHLLLFVSLTQLEKLIHRNTQVKRFYFLIVGVANLRLF